MVPQIIYLYIIYNLYQERRQKEAVVVRQQGNV